MTETWLVGVALCIGFIITVVVWRWGTRLRASRVAQRRSHRAQRGEQAAETLLREGGYIILGRQVSHTWPIRCDGAIHLVKLRADMIVEHSGQHYVAEVKTGAKAPQITTPATRRQLLEYRMAYDVDGVLLVDVEAWQIIHIEFPGGGGGDGSNFSTFDTKVEKLDPSPPPIRGSYSQNPS